MSPASPETPAAALLLPLLSPEQYGRRATRAGRAAVVVPVRARGLLGLAPRCPCLYCVLKRWNKPVQEVRAGRVMNPEEREVGENMA